MVLSPCVVVTVVFPLRAGIAVHLEIFVGRVFVSVDLHVGDMTLLGGHGLVDLLGKRRINTCLIHRERGAEKVQSGANSVLRCVHTERLRLRHKL